jgi:hypothetical protein
VFPPTTRYGIILSRRLVNTYDHSSEITTEVVEMVTRTILHYRGKIKDHGINPHGCHEWYICDADGKPVYIAFQTKADTWREDSL